MADLELTAFLPEEWEDFAALVDALCPSGVRLWRWEEDSFEDGTRRRAAQVVRQEGGPLLDQVAAEAIARARAAGFDLTRIDGELTVLDDRSRTLRIGIAPLPPRLLLELTDRLTHRGAKDYPAIAELFRMAAGAGAARFASLSRFAELDVENPERFYPPSTTMIARGPYDRAGLCAALAAAGFLEDGDAWVRENGRHDVVSSDSHDAPVPSARATLRDEVRLADDAVTGAVIPHHLAR